MKNKKVRAKKKGKIDEGNFLKLQYIKSWNYLKESKNFIYFSILAFFLFALVGFFFPAPEAVANKIIELFKDILSKTEGLSGFELIIFIFKNNIQASLLGLVFGIVFGIYPIFAIIFNGYVVGFAGKLATINGGVYSLLSLIPHGIFELPAIFISFALGIKLGSFIFKKDKLESLKDYISNSFRIFILIVIPLLIVAAIIEGILIAILS